MDLSINNLDNKAKNIGFKGVKYTYNSKNAPVLKFVAPPHKKDEKVSLEIAFYAQNNQSGALNVKTLSFQDNDIIELSKGSTESIVKGGSKGVLYRYKIEGSKKVKNEATGEEEVKPYTRYSIDSSEEQKVGNDSWNILKTSKNFGITPKTGTMRHSFLDSDVSGEYLQALKDARMGSEIQIPTSNPDFIRNHFNKLGGSLEGLDYLVTKTDELAPYRYIISTPDIGADPTSSHKYWPNNLYQCSNLETFKNLNFHLFERGKGYVADGAFTSQSMQSPLIQHVCKWGEASPWFKRLKLEEGMELGVLPNDDNSMQHVGVKIINNPNSKDYEKTKPTLIQFFDDRLLSNSERNSNKLSKKTDKTPQDHYEITANDDSVYMFSFEINPEDKKRIDVFKDKNSVLLKDIQGGFGEFLVFDNFSIVRRHLASRGQYWDGNRDMIKMNFSNSENYDDMKLARKYIYDAATYWTETIQSDLILKTAKATKEKRAAIAANNDVDIDSIKVSEIPQDQFPILKQNKTIKDYVRNFPVQSLETSPELSAIFAQSEFQEEFFNRDTVSTIAHIIDTTIANATPEKYKKDNEYKAYVIKLFSNEILRHIIAGAMCPKIVEDGSVNLEALKNITLKSFQTYEPTTPAQERSQIVKALTKGITSQSVAGIEEELKNTLRRISLEDFKLAESIVLQGKGGLNWRFDAAKDIADLDAVRAENANFKDIWPEAQEFWTNFIGNVRQYNPSSYIINELTDLWSFYGQDKKSFNAEGLDPAQFERGFLNATGSTTASNYSQYFNKLSCFVGANPEKLDKDDNNPLVLAGNLEKLKGFIHDFTSVNQPNNIDLSHAFVENHDKPRVLHVLPLNQEIFHSATLQGSEYEQLAKRLTGIDNLAQISPKAVAVAQAIEKEIDTSNFTFEEQTTLKKALALLASGRKEETSPADFKRAEAFAIAPYEISIRDMFKLAGITDNIDDKVLDFHSKMLAKPMIQQLALWQMMNAIPGTPTLFNGAEFAQTGYESLNKNVYVQNRNQILHSLQNDKRYKKYFEKMQAISGLYRLPKLSAIRDGAKIACEITGVADFEEKLPISYGDFDQGNINYIIDTCIASHGGVEKLKQFIDSQGGLEQFKTKTGIQTVCDKAKEEIGIWNSKDNLDRLVEYLEISRNENPSDPYKKIQDTIKIYEKNKEIDERNSKILSLLPIYSYNDKGSQVIQFITSFNTPKKDYANNAELAKHTEEAVSIKMKDCPFKEGTKLYRKVYINGKTYSDETVGDETKAPRQFIVKKGAIVPVDEKPIIIDDTVLTFYKA